MKTYNLFVACFFAIVLSSSVVSCGDDNDEVFKVDCVVRDTVEIRVPNEGGEYTVKVDLPGKLQLEKNELILSNSFAIYMSIEMASRCAIPEWNMKKH